MHRDTAKARRIVGAFVTGSWSALWEDMIAKRTKRPEGCLIDALGIPCPENRRDSIAKIAANAIRARFRRTSENRNEWDRKKGKWTDKELADVIEIAETSMYQQLGSTRPSMDSVSVSSTLTSIRTTSLPVGTNQDLSMAIGIVQEFGKLSFNASNWEKMIGNRQLPPYGCLIDALGIECPQDRLEEVKLVGAQALRAKYPTFTKSPVAWERKEWHHEDLLEIVAIVDRVVRECLAKPSLALPVMSRESPEIAIGTASATGPNGFIPWRLFRERFPVSRSPGVYLFAYFENGAAENVDPLDSQVIYIGIAEGQATGDRLDQFERTALGGLGHTGGFSYRTEFVRDVFRNDYSLLRGFHKTHCSWRDLSISSNITPRQLEQSLLQEYRLRWGSWPRLNKKG